MATLHLAIIYIFEIIAVGIGFVKIPIQCNKYKINLNCALYVAAMNPNVSFDISQYII